MEPKGVVGASQPHWRDAMNDPPRPGERVIGTDGFFVGEVYRTLEGDWVRYYGVNVTVVTRIVRWMPLPEPPKEE